MSSDNELSQDEAFLKKLKQIVLENITNEQFGVEHLSQEIGMSRSHLYRKLKLLKGESISHFIRQIRMEEAMDLLQKDVGSVSEIAYRVGFNTPSYFHKCFHDHYGYSPGEVKNMNQKIIDNTLLIPNKKNHWFIKLISQRKLVTVVISALAIGIFFTIYYGNPPLKTSPLKSIAILPLKSLSKDIDQAYLALGMHDAIIGELGKVSGLRVISKTSTLPFLENTAKLLPEIAKELGVQVIVEGSMFIKGDSVRLQIQLIEVFPKEKHLWAQEYHEKISNILSVQSELVHNIASEVKVNLTPDENKLLGKNRTIDPETYKHYLRGMYYLNNRNQESFDKGIMHLKKAVELDPADPFAYAGLALGYALLGHGPASEMGLKNHAKAAAMQALRLDENMANAHTALAMIYMYHEWDWEKAKNSFDRALNINPNNEFAHAHLAWLCLLMNENDLGVKHGELACAINPLYPTYQLWLSWIHQFIGNTDTAIEEANKLLKFEPNFTFAHYILGNCYYDQGNYEKALLEYEKIGFKNDFILSVIGDVLVNLGQKEKALEILNQMHLLNKKESANPVYMAFIYASLQKKDSAMTYLNKAYNDKIYPLPWIKYTPPIKTMKKDPELINLYKRMNLPL